MGMDVRSGLSSSSDLRKKSDSGDCSILSQEAQSSPEAVLKEYPPNIGETGEPVPGDGAESVVSSAALQSSMELYTGVEKFGGYVYVELVLENDWRDMVITASQTRGVMI